MLNLWLTDSFEYLINYSSQVNNLNATNAILVDSEKNIVWLKFNNVTRPICTVAWDYVEDILTPIQGDFIWDKPWYFLISWSKKWTFINKWNVIKYSPTDKQVLFDELLTFNNKIW